MTSMKSRSERIRAREMRDIKAPDGLLAHGWRWVREGGRLKYGGSWFQHEKLKEFIGRQVLVYTADTHILTVEVSEDYDKPIATVTTQGKDSSDVRP